MSLLNSSSAWRSSSSNIFALAKVFRFLSSKIFFCRFNVSEFWPDPLISDADFTSDSSFRGTNKVGLPLKFEFKTLNLSHKFNWNHVGKSFGRFNAKHLKDKT